ncbi:alpha/beta fold hydrolase [Undibacterium sp. CY18W]|uniref:Alpha/beta fold hydrolase n=1 Tax=Undibacterium hunanense TaxID=2762292 RepID=A0ABR6ZXJ5_9BURK|nr:alpha/beta fold hydrolase [Undibacterium hunanense]MBC3920576.1 alpha/beta fold hydrolase [Undibacterium hunanense]
MTPPAPDSDSAPALNAARSEQTYWHCYHDPALLARVLAVVQTRHLSSTGVELHMDLYQQQDPAAPVLILNHGGGGYGGLFIGLALAFYEQGYTVVVPDQKGQGRSGGVMGDFTVSEAVQNIVDVAAWARQEFNAPLFLCGGSIGGGLTYAAAAVMASQGLAPAAIVCLNLYDFGDPATGLAFTRFAALATLPGLAKLCRVTSGLLARLAPRLRLPYRPLARFEHMVDERDLAQGFYAKWQADPLTLRTVTANYFASMLDTAFVIPLEANAQVPVLVINQQRDKMVKPQLTLNCFQRLSGPKAYAELDWGHFSLQTAFIDQLICLGHDWLLQHAASWRAKQLLH